VAYNYKGKPVTAKDLKAHGAMTILMKDTIKPNLVQSIEGVPAFVHGGPFANIAHGCNSLIATKLALKVSDYVVTEAGFGADLGAEKFFDIKCRIGNLKPSAAVIVVTTRALIRQGYGSGQKDYEALKKGLANLEKHIQNVKYFGVPVIVSINKFDGDTDKHFNIIKEKCSHLGVNAVVSEGHKLGGNGTKELAKEVIKLCGHKSKIKFLYKTNQSIKHKIETIAHKIYGAEKIRYNPEAERDIEHLEKLGLNKLPICMAKTQYSLSDDPKKLGKPENFQINIRQVKVNAGAGFIVAYTSNIMTMPGLPKHPAAENMDISNTGKITGLF
jgi:formate--tetrahydrofolate ligase